MEHSDSYLSLCNVSKIFQDGQGGRVKAVDNIILNIQKGEFVTLLGPSGCGKTTTLRIVAGFEIQDSGNIFLDGRNINNVAAYERNMPMVFQSYALFPHLNIYENISYGLKIRKIPKNEIQNEIEKVCRMVNLSGLEKRFPGELSGGQQQRVALARALVLKPQIMLFDEPLSNLDAKLRIQTRTEIMRVQQILNITTIYVTHDQSEALSMSDRIVVMNKGKIEQFGTPNEIYSHPKTPFVADFIGNANFLEVCVKDNREQSVVVSKNDGFLEIPKYKSDQYHKGEKLLLAVKPEAIRVTDNRTGFPAVIEVVSYLGATTEYEIVFDGKSLTAIQTNTGHAKTRKNGDPVYLNFETESIHIFKLTEYDMGVKID